MRSIIVGDVHAEKREIDDCQKLIELIDQSCSRLHPNNIIFLGDQNHTHNIVTIDVLDFWKQSFDRLKSRHPEIELIALVGNHDMPGDGRALHFMTSYQNVVTVSDPICVGGINLMGYQSTEEAFLRKTEGLSGTLICHQSFVGAQFENGYYDPHGFDHEKTDFTNIISGHIHKPGNVGKVWFPGAPRWRTASDANTDRFIYFVEFTPDSYTLIEKIPTATHCSPIYALKHSKDEMVSIDGYNNNDRLIIDIIGEEAWVNQQKEEFKGKARIRAVYQKTQAAVVKESEGMAKSVDRFFESYSPKFIQDKNDIKKAVELIKSEVF